ncbi:hypothetical protein BKI52_44590 [marine bacterium AO1-C]|nr:hypothetical protein BKI52_44590 [marine bacterium AO1-C]
MKEFQSLKIREYLGARFQNYSINPDTYLKTLGVTNQVNYDRYAAPRNLTVVQQFQLLLLDLEPHYDLKPRWEAKLDARDWLEYCQTLIQKTSKIKAESSWWFANIFKTRDLAELAQTLQKVLEYKLIQLYQLFSKDIQLIQAFIGDIPSPMFFQHAMFLEELEQEIVFHKKYEILNLDTPIIEVSHQNQFKELLDEYVVYELQVVQKWVNEAEINRDIFRRDLKTIAQNVVQNVRSDNQIKTKTRQKAGLLSFDLQLRAMGWLTTVKEESTSLTKQTIKFLKFTAPLTASVGGLLLLMYLLKVL